MPLKVMFRSIVCASLACLFAVQTVVFSYRNASWDPYSVVPLEGPPFGWVLIVVLISVLFMLAGLAAFKNSILPVQQPIDE